MATITHIWILATIIAITISLKANNTIIRLHANKNYIKERLAYPAIRQQSSTFYGYNLSRIEI